MEQASKRDGDFDTWLRTGRQPRNDRATVASGELKFNPNHDPSDGRFTFGPGGSGGVSGSGAAALGHGSSSRRADPPTAKPAVAPAAKPATAKPHGWDLGVLSQNFEAPGSDDAGRVSNDPQDPGGISYGSYQFSTKKKTAAEFVASPQAAHWVGDFHGLTPGSASFSAKWREVAARDPVGFKEAQFAFIKRRNYDWVVASVAKSTGYDIDHADLPVRQAAFSTAMQNGRPNLLLRDAVRAADRMAKRTDRGIKPP